MNQFDDVVTGRRVTLCTVQAHLDASKTRPPCWWTSTSASPQAEALASAACSPRPSRLRGLHGFRHRAGAAKSAAAGTRSGSRPAGCSVPRPGLEPAVQRSGAARRRRPATSRRPDCLPGRRASRAAGPKEKAAASTAKGQKQVSIIDRAHHNRRPPTSRMHRASGSGRVRAAHSGGRGAEHIGGYARGSVRLKVALREGLPVSLCPSCRWLAVLRGARPCLRQYVSGLRASLLRGPRISLLLGAAGPRARQRAGDG